MKQENGGMGGEGGALVPALRAELLKRAGCRAMFDKSKPGVQSNMGDTCIERGLNVDDVCTWCLLRMAHTALLQAAEAPPEVAAPESQGEGATHHALVPLPGAAAIPSPPSPETAACTCGPRDKRGWRDPHCPDHGEFPIVPAGPSPEPEPETAAETLIARLQDYYQFECPGGPLKNCVEWIALCALVARWREERELERLAHQETRGAVAAWKQLVASVFVLTASGRTLPELLSTAADVFRQYGDGPLAQDLAITAQRLEGYAPDGIRFIETAEATCARLEADLAAVREAVENALTIATAELGTVGMDINKPRRSVRQIRDLLDAVLAAAPSARGKDKQMEISSKLSIEGPDADGEFELTYDTGGEIFWHYITRAQADKLIEALQPGAPEGPRTKYDSGDCCMRDHQTAVPPWTCSCVCHQPK